MPNSKGLVLTDSLYNDRYYQIGTPAMYVFTPQEPNGMAVVLCPSGGYHHLTMPNSGYGLAKWLSKQGITAFVLTHRLPTTPDAIDRSLVALQDLQRAISTVRHEAEKWGLNKDMIGVAGCSAGGHLAASSCVITKDVSDVGDAISDENHVPDFMFAVSPVITMRSELTHRNSKANLLGANPSQELQDKFSLEKHVTKNTPPALLIHADDDAGVSAMNSVMFYEQLKAHGVKAALYVFPTGGHGISLENQPEATSYWPTLVEIWLKELKNNIANNR